MFTLKKEYNQCCALELPNTPTNAIGPHILWCIMSITYLVDPRFCELQKNKNDLLNLYVSSYFTALTVIDKYNFTKWIQTNMIPSYLWHSLTHMKCSWINIPLLLIPSLSSEIITHAPPTGVSRCPSFHIYSKANAYRCVALHTTNVLYVELQSVQS